MTLPIHHSVCKVHLIYHCMNLLIFIYSLPICSRSIISNIRKSIFVLLSCLQYGKYISIQTFLIIISITINGRIDIGLNSKHGSLFSYFITITFIVIVISFKLLLSVFENGANRLASNSCRNFVAQLLLV